MVLRTLNEKRNLISTKDYKRDLKVGFENGSESTVRVYSLSAAILSDEARERIDKALISDRFHALDIRSDNFYPYIVHPQYDMLAGQLICYLQQLTSHLLRQPAKRETEWLITTRFT